MTSRGAQSSQVGLFITQISEQILRLRALTHAEDDAAPHDLVALKRAIMATRLLGGSARILQFGSVHRFLENLLVWLQRIEERGAKPTPTQALILDSVIDLEEQLMRQLEAEVSDDELRRFEGEFEQLLRLMERSAEWTQTAERREPGEEDSKPIAEGPAEPGDVARLVDLLGSLVDQLEETSPDQIPPVAPPVWNQLDEMSRRLAAVISRHAELSEDHPVAADAGSPEPGPEAEAAPVPDWPRDDPILDPLWEQIESRSMSIRLPIRFTADGGAEIVGAGLHEIVHQILELLIGDVLHVLEDWHHDHRSAPARVHIGIARESHRLHIAITDSASTQTPLQVDTDHLTLYDGLRRARFLIQQLNGLIAVEPQDDSEVRFRLVLPAELRDQTYMVVHLDQVAVALPWVLTDGEMSVEDLRLEADAGGESFVRHGRSVPLVDLAHYVPSLMPVADSADIVLIAGSVEKRIGILCSETGERIDADQVEDPPPGWEAVAYGGLDVRGEILPVLDVHRVIRLRFDMPDSDRGVSGALPNPLVDSYVAVDEPSPAAGVEQAGWREQDLEPPGRGLRVLLVNQSEFRRRDLQRSLQELGHIVKAYADLTTALGHSQLEGFDVVVTDLRLGQTTRDNLESLHEGSFVGPVILTSAAARDQAELLAKKVGADACWLDPYRPSDFESLQRALF